MDDARNFSNYLINVLNELERRQVINIVSARDISSLDEFKFRQGGLFAISEIKSNLLTAYDAFINEQNFFEYLENKNKEKGE